jgi:glucose-1-phosphate adenylyltransferase
LPPGTRIGFDPECDRQRYYLDPSGIVVVPAGHRQLDLVY